MKFGMLPLEEAEGAILAHTLRAAGSVLKKGRRLAQGDLAALAAAGVTSVMAARLETGDLGEDEVAETVARALAGPGVRVAPGKTGRANLYASVAGLWRIDAARVDAMNGVGEAITVATLPSLVPVAPGEMVATVKVIPFAVPAATMARCVDAAGREPAGSVHAFRPMRAGLVLTRLPGQPEARLDQGAQAVGQRLEALGSALVREIRCAHDVASVGAALRELDALDVDLALVLGASAIVDRQDVIPAAIELAGGTIEHFGMPVDPGNLILLASHQGSAAPRPIIGVPSRAPWSIIGVPSCARSPKRSGFDMVLERLVAGLPVGPREVMGMGVGGLLPDIPSRPGPREGGSVHEGARRANRVAGLLLAAGSSRRMGERNKLLVPIEGRPMVAHAADTLRTVAEVVVVTGHEAEQVEGALAGRELRFVHNPDHAEGLASSLKAGIRALPEDADGVLVCLGDMPWVRAETLARLIGAFAPDEGAAICVPLFEGKRGNPVLWARRFFPELLALAGDTGARELLARHGDEIAWVDVSDPGILWDVDTEAALKALLPASESREGRSEEAPDVIARDP